MGNVVSKHRRREDSAVHLDRQRAANVKSVALSATKHARRQGSRGTNEELKETLLLNSTLEKELDIYRNFQ